MTKRITVDAQIFPEDLVPPEGPERDRVMRHVRSLVDYVPDLVTSDGNLVARALLVPSPTFLGDHWLDPYTPLGPAWLELARQLNGFNHPYFCVIVGVAEPSTTFILDSDGDLEERPRTGRVIKGGSAYTLPLSIEVPRRSAAQKPLATPPHDDRLLRPADATDPALRALAAHLAPRIAGLPGGKVRLEMAPVLAPIIAMAVSVSAIMNETSRVQAKARVYRADVLTACLDALQLGEHRRTAERILLRDDPEHLHVDAWTAAPSTNLPERIAPKGMRKGLGMFVHNARGDLVKARRGDRREHRPRIFYSLAGPEPR